MLRAYHQRYAHLPGYPRASTLISYMGVQNGVFGVPDFNGPNSFCPLQDPICRVLADALDEFLLDPNTTYAVQTTVTFAAFWKDALNYPTYTVLNDYLADVNNERPTSKNPQYKKNLLGLRNLVLVYGTLDDTVVPQTSPIFSFFAPGNVSQIVPLQESPQYLQDWLGLQTLDKTGRLHLYSVPCHHTNVASSECKPYVWPITVPFLGGNQKK